MKLPPTETAHKTPYRDTEHRGMMVAWQEPTLRLPALRRFLR